MQIVRKTSVGLLAFLFVVNLLVFGFGFGLLYVFGNIDVIKSALARSGIYQTLVSDVLEQDQRQQSASRDMLPLDRPEVQHIIKTAASPDLLQSKTENALDATYAWMRGETPSLEFNLETTDIKTNLANGLEQYAAQRIASLPVCPAEEADSARNDPFNATCRPGGADISQLAAEAKSDFWENWAIPNGTFSANEIKVNGDKTLAQKLKGVPSVYQRISWSIYGSGTLALLLSAGVVFFSANWRSGLKKASIILVVVGTVTIAVSALISVGMSQAAGYAKEPLQQSIFKVADALAGELRSWWLWYGIALTVTGAVTLVVLRLTNKTAHELAKPAGSTGEAPGAGALPVMQTASSSDPAAPQPPVKPKPPKKLVQ